MWPITLITYQTATSVIKANERTHSYLVSSKKQGIILSNDAPITMPVEHIEVDTAGAAVFT